MSVPFSPPRGRLIAERSIIPPAPALLPSCLAPRAAETPSPRCSGAPPDPGPSSRPSPAPRCTQARTHSAPWTRRRCSSRSPRARSASRRAGAAPSKFVPVNAPQRCLVTRTSSAHGSIAGTISAQSGGNAIAGRPASVRPGAMPSTFTSATVIPRARNARASAAARATISPVGCAIGIPAIPFCRSITTSAASASSDSITRLSEGAHPTRRVLYPSFATVHRRRRAAASPPSPSSPNVPGAGVNEIVPLACSV